MTSLIKVGRKDPNTITSQIKNDGDDAGYHALDGLDTEESVKNIQGKNDFMT